MRCVAIASEDETWLNQFMVEDTVTLQVIRDAKEEERAAMDEVVRSFQPVLFYIASCHLKSDALIKSTVRTCLGKLFVLLSGTEDLSSFNGKAMSMVVRACLNAALTEDSAQNFFSAEGSDPHEEVAVYTDEDEVPGRAAGITEREAMNIVVRMLRKMPDDQRMVFVMRYLDGISFSRMSMMIHVPKERLEKRAQLAKNRLSAVTRRSVQDVFAIVSLAEQNKYLVIDEPQPAAAVSAPAPAVMKNRFSFRFLAAALVLLVLAGGAMRIFRKPDRVSVLTDLTCSFAGINGLGTAEVEINKTGNKKLDEVIETSSCTLEAADHLSNGDILKYSCDFDETALKKAHLEITESETEVTVKGLKEPVNADLFEDVHLEGTVNEETGEPELIAVSDHPVFKDISYSVAEISEEGVLVEADIDAETLLSNGYVTDKYTRLYSSAEDIPSSMRGYVRQKIVADGLLETADHFDQYGFEVANGTDPVINALAQKYIGRAGACNEIANAFIYELYGVHVKTGYSRQNTYEVNSPEPGDLVYYYDSSGNYTHVATYIGNGLVLNGNYSDGRAHITSMYESLYAQNPMVFLRVER